MMRDHDHERQIAAFGACPVCVRASAQEADARAKPEADEDGKVVARCEFCGDEVAINEPRVHRAVSGWTTYRGATGGTHTLRLRQEHHQYAHGECIDRAKAGRLNQPELALDPVTSAAAQAPARPARSPYPEDF